MIESVGLIVCGCGPNISEKIDLPMLTADFSRWPGVKWAKSLNLPCSEDGKKEVIQILADDPVEALIVAGCSPKEHEKTFRGCMEKAGMNPFMLQFVNVREHCAWVENSPEMAYMKTRSLLAGALGRVRFHSPFEAQTATANPDVVVIGAGVAGMEAALMMARRGRKVHLIERESSIGGRVPLLNEVFPAMECSSCLIEPMMDEILHHKNISLHLLSEVADVRGFCGNFHVVISKKARRVDLAACYGCGQCYDACPASAPNEANGGIDQRKAVFVPYQGAMPNVPAIDPNSCIRFKGEQCDACAKSCPFQAINLDEVDSTIEVKAGAIVIAVGAGSDRLIDEIEPNLWTAQHFERVLSPSGPTKGEILLTNGLAPERIAVVSHGYSSEDSKLISTNVAKYALSIKKKLPNAKVDIYLSDWCLLGAQEQSRRIEIEDSENVTVKRYTTSDGLSIDSATGTVRYLGLDREEINENYLIILCGPAMPPNGADKLAQMLGLTLNERGFFKPEHEIVEPVNTTIRGVFVAGSAMGPRTIRESIMQGAAVAGKIESLLPEGSELELNPFVSIVDEEMCSGCRACYRVCPYRAIVPQEDGKMRVEGILCHGCGLCSAACPSGAMQTRNFTEEQIEAEVAGLCWSS